MLAHWSEGNMPMVAKIVPMIYPKIPNTTAKSTRWKRGLPLKSFVAISSPFGYDIRYILYRVQTKLLLIAEPIVNFKINWV